MVVSTLYINNDNNFHPPIKIFTSGAINSAVPLNVFISFPVSRRCARPKSMIFMVLESRLHKTMFSGLRSRCTIFYVNNSIIVNK